MDSIKYVIDELNQAPFSQNLNLIAYDNLRAEQRLDLLIQVLNVIDPKLNLPLVRVGNIEEIVTTILDTLRIFKFSPPLEQSNPVEFRKNLILADKELLTNILEWLLHRLSALKKRAYLARFLVKIELSAEVEGDHDVLLIYKQYLRLIEEFKKAHSSYESQKKSLDSIIELQKDIKTMEVEREQISNKLESVRRRVNLGQTGDYSPAIRENQARFEAARKLVEAKHENDKLQRQLRDQAERIETTRTQVETLQAQLTELRMIDLGRGSGHSPEVMLERMKEDLAIKQRLAKDVLPGELSELRVVVREMESIATQPEPSIKEYLSKTSSQIQSISKEINELMERKLMEKDRDEDRLMHYRQNAQTVAEKKNETIQRCQEIEKKVAEVEAELEERRAQFGAEGGELPLRGEALKLYIEKISQRDSEMESKRRELSILQAELEQLNKKIDDLRKQENEVLGLIGEREEFIGTDGYFAMKESTLNIAVDDDGDGVEDSGVTQVDIDRVNSAIRRLQERVDTAKSSSQPLARELKQLKQQHHELENEFDMKKRLYDSAAAGLEAELSRLEAELDRLGQTRRQLEAKLFEAETQLLACQSERALLTSQSAEAGTMRDKLREEIEQETLVQNELRQRETERQNKEDYYRKQIEYWRDLRAIFEVKTKILAQKQEEQTRKDMLINSNVNHLVLG